MKSSGMLRLVHYLPVDKAQHRLKTRYSFVCLCSAFALSPTNVPKNTSDDICLEVFVLSPLHYAEVRIVLLSFHKSFGKSFYFEIIITDVESY
jgi:hypothetical protein